MVIFPWKQKIVGQSIQRCSAKKSGQPLDKNSWSARAATVSNLQQKIKTKVWSCSRKLSTRAEEGVYWFARPPLQTCSALSQVYSNKKSENLWTIYQENRRPWATVCTAGKHKTCRHFLFPSPNVASAWGKARHFLSIGQPLFAESQANNERTNTTTRSLGGGAARRGRWRSKGLLRGLWVLEIMTKIISWKFI